MEHRFSILATLHDGAVAPQELAGNTWCLAILGEGNELDLRTKEATAYARSVSRTVATFAFQAADNSFRWNKEKISLSRLTSLLGGTTSLLIETTSLSFPEIVYLFQAAIKNKCRNIRCVYVEPMAYRRPIQDALCDLRNFDLSENRRFKAIPNFVTNLTEAEPGRAVFFLGYEGNRLGQALEQIEALQKWSKSVVFGVPAFVAGWENDAIANNIDHLGKAVSIEFAAAASAGAAYRLLCRLRSEDKEDKPILVAPLGTKPHAIGAALFLLEFESYDRAILLYDHAERSMHRSESVRRWHLFDILDFGDLS